MLVALVALVAELLNLEETTIVMLDLLAVVFAATRWGKAPAATAALLSVLAYDFFFLPPHRALTFALQDGQNFLTFACLLVVGLTTADLTSRVRELAAERVRLVEEARAGELARETERLQSALLNSISHDLQTPIASIVGALDGLCDSTITLDEDSRRSLLQTAREETSRLHRLVRNLLDMTRLESGPRLEKEECDLQDLIGTALAQLEEQLAGRPVNVHIAPDTPPVKVGFVLFNQVLVNLLENAAKYSPPRSPIDITCFPDRGVVVEVADRGPGIPPEEQERVFDKFHRLHWPGVSGTGLGLTISRGLVEAHGGTLVARNREGGGTRMVIRLP